jgi:hypothetical protein
MSIAEGHKVVDIGPSSRFLYLKPTECHAIFSLNTEQSYKKLKREMNKKH